MKKVLLSLGIFLISSAYAHDYECELKKHQNGKLSTILNFQVSSDENSDPYARFVKENDLLVSCHGIGVQELGLYCSLSKLKRRNAIVASTFNHDSEGLNLNLMANRVVFSLSCTR